MRYIDNTRTDLTETEVIALLTGEAKPLYQWDGNGFRQNQETQEKIHEASGMTSREISEESDIIHWVECILEEPELSFWFWLAQWFLGDLNPNCF